jgi:hypothetical protein
MTRTVPLELDYPPLMLCQLDALRAYAAKHGVHWKDDLRAAWVTDTISPSLSRLRATHGSRWLSDFRFQH